MPAPSANPKLELAYGSLDLLILQTLLWGPTHGHAIAKSIERNSADAFRVEHGSLYPALQRLCQEGWIKGDWAVTENKQRAKYYQLTARGRKKLIAETSRWERFAQAIGSVLRPAPSETE
jgi:PadR family transcriptional regulator PadR